MRFAPEKTQEANLAKRKPLRLNEPSNFEIDTLEKLADDLKKGRIPLDRVTVSDDRVVGLRAIVTKDGRITFHASYHFGEGRPFLKLGEMTLPQKHPDHISFTDARELTKTIKALADKGIDPQDGLHRRLLRELKRDGVSWRPR